MALLFVDGFDAGDYVIKGWTPASVVASSTTTAFGAGRSIEMTATTRNVVRGIPFSGAAIIGVRVQTPVTLAAFSPVVFYADAGVRQHGWVRVNANGSIDILRGGAGTLLASSAAGIIASDSWYYLEVSATVADSGGVITVMVNGVQVVTFTGDTRDAGTSTQIDTVRLIGNARFDDFYACDSTGSAPYNTFLGDVRVHTIVPTGAGNSTQLTPSTGSNWAAVDELPYSATDYVSSGTAGHKDTYATGDVSGVGTIFAVQNNLIGKKTDAGARSVKNITRSGGTDYSGSTIALATTDTTVYTVRTADPATSAAWTGSGVNAAEFGLEVV